MNVRAVRLDRNLQIRNCLAEYRFLLLLLTFCLSIEESVGLGLGDSSGGMGYFNTILSSSGQIHADDAPVSGGGLRFVPCPAENDNC